MDERPTNGYAYVLGVDPGYAKERGNRAAQIEALAGAIRKVFEQLDQVPVESERAGGKR